MPSRGCFVPPWSIGDTVFPRISPLVKMRVIAYWLIGESPFENHGVQVQTRWMHQGKSQTQWWYVHELDADDT